ncbi:hypothetical protein Poli38472_004421 [Pythium oligandrum]|uniref:Uncharacterized protein n=1 Tax=Pythium oligandrum TaxID=41045 RepID=A0A8K1CBI6_PYTOL|nr:hypothetical protein Poli38472_004421 [Pythium oligandrum]|eukprot:TMW59352.1 hypothetical protein Poli38472_004421 [Pythium oligandrum]
MASSPNLIDFGDSPRDAPPAQALSFGDDPFAVSHASSGSVADDPFAIVAASTASAETTRSSIDMDAPSSSRSTFSFLNRPSLETTRPSLSTLPATVVAPPPSLRVVEPTELHFFVSCTGVDGNYIQTATRSAQTLMRGALSMLAQTSGGKNRSPRSKPPTEVTVEVRVTREFALVGHEHEAALTSSALLESESYWSERRKSRNPHFAVGFNVKCHLAAMRDRHIQIMVMIPDENGSNKNSQQFGYAQTSFQELYMIATSGNYQQTTKLPVHSTVLEGATVEIRFADIHAWKPALFHGYNSVFHSFLFYPLMKESQTLSHAVSPKLALEEVAEVDYSVKIPVQLLKVCHFELKQMHEEWKARYNYNRKQSRHFEDDAEALNFGHDVFRVQVICGRDLSGSDSHGREGSGSNASRPSTFSSITGGRNAIMNRIKTASKWGGGSDSSDMNSNGGDAVSPFVVVKYCDGIGGVRIEQIVGKTNTEYETAAPIWSMNKSASNCPHGKPNLKFAVSPSLPSRVDISPVNQLKQFLFYRPSVAQHGQEIEGWLRFEVYDETYGIMSGVENELVGEVVIPLQSVRDAMTVEEKIIWEGEDGTTERRAHSVHSLTLVDWFDVRSPTNDAVRGQIQLRLNILLANPMVSTTTDLLGDGSDPVLSPRRQRLAADCAPPSSNPLENEMPLEFLHPHVLMLQHQISEVTNMIRLTEHLVEQKKTFKSSQHKKRADIQGIPTNLHVSYFRIYRNYASPSSSVTTSSSSSSTSTALPPPPVQTERRASTEDLLGLGSPLAIPMSAQVSTAAPGGAPIAPLSLTSVFQSLQERAKFAESHVTITCGAPTAHAMGLSDYGLREMELEIHRLQTLLDRCSPRFTGSTHNVISQEFVSEDAAEFAFSSLPEEFSYEDDDSVAGSPQVQDQTPSADAASTSASPKTSATPTAQQKKYSNFAARAVAGAKAKTVGRAKRNSVGKPPRTKAKQPANSDDNATSGPDIRYPSLKTEPDDGVDPMTSVTYAVRLLCRLEMLRTEYYLRKSVSVAQSVSSLVTCFVAKLDLCLQEKNSAVIEQMAAIGFLIGWESLISSHGKELRMLSDAWVAIKCLETFAFQLHEIETDDSTATMDHSCQDVVLEKREHVGYTIRVPVPSPLFRELPENLRNGELISITSVLFTQGINEMQSLANMVGHSGVSIQSKINSTSFRSIVEYYNRFNSTGLTLAESHVGSHPDEILRNLRVSVESENSASKNTGILFHAGDAVRSLNGGRITYCKSGKDRTAMSVTLEQARLLVQRKRHVLQEIMEVNNGGSASDAGPLEEVKYVANTMREFGVRIDIAKKNVGRYKYSFNSLQRKLLPEIYRPPMSTIQDMEELSVEVVQALVVLLLQGELSLLKSLKLGLQGTFTPLHEDRTYEPTLQDYHCGVEYGSKRAIHCLHNATKHYLVPLESHGALL